MLDVKKKHNKDMGLKAGLTLLWTVSEGCVLQVRRGVSLTTVVKYSESITEEQQAL